MEVVRPWPLTRELAFEIFPRVSPGQGSALHTIVPAAAALAARPRGNALNGQARP
jgi:hypothetical protein